MEEYLLRRKKLLERLPDNSIVISFSGNEIRKSADEGFEYTPDYSFFYLTGIKQASTILLMSKNSIMSDEYLFIQKFDAFIIIEIILNKVIDISRIDTSNF